MLKTDIAGLSRLVNLPYTPTWVKWTTTKLPGRDDWGLDALLSFRAEDTRALLQSAERFQGGEPTVLRAHLVEWFPEAVKSELASALKTSAERVTVDAVHITGVQFAAPDKSPAIHGDALVFEKYNLVYLSLFTM